jgi:hypothetical protein
VGFLKRSNGGYASVSTRRPIARSDDLIIEEVDDELLVYDSESKRAHCLTPTAARVWRACDGQKDASAIVLALDMSQEDVDRALDELGGANLLDSPELEILNGNGSGITRRAFGSRSIQAGAAVAAAPMIYSIVAPTPAAAGTPPPFVCNLYTSKSCGGTGDGGCGATSGCCCCDSGCAGQGSCKVCSSIGFCNAGSQQCGPPDTGNSNGCSNSTGHGGVQPGGCCAFGTTDKQGNYVLPTGCGCLWGPAAGCCDATTHGPCTSATNCVPCCNGVQIQQGGTPTNPLFPAYNCCQNTTSTCPATCTSPGTC